MTSCCSASQAQRTAGHTPMEAVLASDAGPAIRSYVGWTLPYCRRQLQASVKTR